MADPLRYRHLTLAWLALLVFQCCACGQEAAAASPPESTYAERMAAKVIPHLMGFLPDTLRAVHERGLASDFSYMYENRWENGQPEYFVTSIDTASVDADTILWVLFSDGVSAQLTPLGGNGGAILPLPCDCERIDGGVFARLEDASRDLNSDGQPDLIVFRDGHRHYLHFSAYLWLGDSVAYAGGFSTAGRDYELRDITGDGVMEVIAGEDDPDGSWELREIRDVVYQLITGQYQVSDSLSAQWRAK